MRNILIAAVLTALIGAPAGCSYKQDIQQGNMLSNADIAQLRKGMTQREVAYILGTPLVSDPFHQDRWDYYYSFKEGRSQKTESRRLTVVFEDDKLASLEGFVTLEDLENLELSEEDTHHGGTVITRSTQRGSGIFERAADAIRDRANDDN